MSLNQTQLNFWWRIISGLLHRMCFSWNVLTSINNIFSLSQSNPIHFILLIFLFIQNHLLGNDPEFGKAQAPKNVIGYTLLKLSKWYFTNTQHVLWYRGISCSRKSSVYCMITMLPMCYQNVYAYIYII